MKKRKGAKTSVSEKRSKVILLDDGAKPLIVTKFDGCVVKQNTAADYVVTKQGAADLIVELKGCDVQKAVKQVRVTADFLTEHSLRSGRIAGLIVCTRFPGEDSQVQLAQRDFAHVYKGPLRGITGTREVSFDAMMTTKVRE